MTGVLSHQPIDLNGLAAVDEVRCPGLQKTLDEALSAARELPETGRFSVETSAWLAAGLIAVGRDQDAKSLVERFPATADGSALRGHEFLDGLVQLGRREGRG